jgi:hypothetical protein
LRKGHREEKKSVALKKTSSTRRILCELCAPSASVALKNEPIETCASEQEVKDS